MLNAQVDKLDLKGQTESLRPMVERSLNKLLDNIAASKPGGIGGMFMSNMIESLRPQVPQYTDVVMKELAKSQTQQAFRDPFAACWPTRSRIPSARKNVGRGHLWFDRAMADFGCWRESSDGFDFGHDLNSFVESASSITFGN